MQEIILPAEHFYFFSESWITQTRHSELLHTPGVQFRKLVGVCVIRALKGAVHQIEDFGTKKSKIFCVLLLSS
jgi:hypothetical protein